MATLVYLRQHFILPAETALEAVSETVVAQGEILPRRAAPAHIAAAVNNLLSRCRLEWEVENRTVREATERRLREITESQKNLLSHHRLTKKMLQSRRTDEVFEILLAGVTEGYGYTGALIGKVSPDGYLVFQGETDPVSGSPLRIPLWNPGSLPSDNEKPRGSLRRSEEYRGPELPRLPLREPEVLVEEGSAVVLLGQGKHRNPSRRHHRLPPMRSFPAIRPPGRQERRERKGIEQGKCRPHFEPRLGSRACS